METRKYKTGEHYDYQLLIKNLLNSPLTYSPDQEIVYRDKFRYTYSEFNIRIHKLANVLSSLNVKMDDTVAVIEYDSHRYLECFFAIPMMGAVLQMINWRLSPEQIVYTLNHTEAKTIIIHEEFLPFLEKNYNDLTFLVTVIVISEENIKIETKITLDANYEKMMLEVSDDYNFIDFDENKKATTFYTTGTTGNLKGVHFSHRQLVLHTFSVAVATGSYETIGRFRSDDIYMPLTPMFHVHAWGFPYIATLLGAKQVYPGKYEPEIILKLVKNEDVTFSHCVPTILQMLFECPSINKSDLSRWKIIIGGSKLNMGLARIANEHGITIYTGYGMSETCPVISLSVLKRHMMNWDTEQQLQIVTKAGLPLPLVEVEIIDTDEEILPHDGETVGEIVFRAPWLTKDYYNDPDKTAELWNNGYLHSGDIGHISKDGYIQVIDRVKDLIKTGGEWVSSLDLENAMGQLNAVTESAAIGIPDPKWGERPMMYVVLDPSFDGEVSIDELKIHMHQASLNGAFPKYGIPDNYKIVDELPKTSVGKLDKKLLRQSSL